MIDITNIKDWRAIVALSILMYLITYFIIRGIRRALRRGDDYSWATVIGNFVLALGGPIAIIIGILIFFDVHNEGRTHFQTKPPKWL